MEASSVRPRRLTLTWHDYYDNVGIWLDIDMLGRGDTVNIVHSESHIGKLWIDLDANGVVYVEVFTVVVIGANTGRVVDIDTMIGASSRISADLRIVLS